MIPASVICTNFDTSRNEFGELGSDNARLPQKLHVP